MSDSVGVPDTARQRGKIAPVKFAHVAYKTSRFNEMIEWYKLVLEAEAMIETPMATFLTYDNEHHRIAFVNLPDLADKSGQTAGVEHCAFTYASIDDLFATYTRLKNAGIEPYWTINHGPTLSMYYQDPDKNQIELQIDIFDSNESFNEWFEQSDFATNPIGVKFDPEDLMHRYQAGEDRDSLLVRQRIDPSEVAAQFP